MDPWSWRAQWTPHRFFKILSPPTLHITYHHCYSHTITYTNTCTGKQTNDCYQHTIWPVMPTLYPKWLSARLRTGPPDETLNHSILPSQGYLASLEHTCECVKLGSICHSFRPYPTSNPKAFDEAYHRRVKIVTSTPHVITRRVQSVDFQLQIQIQQN